ncbi:MAG TPA: hypothetical protein VK434_03145 [Microvirga sp.]|nr:hypothetical protein [Microvirga sp.]
MSGTTKAARLANAARLAIAALTLALGACQTSLGSPEGVPVALESIDGAPAPVRMALADELAAAASERRVELVGSSAEARYRVRGYLSTETEGGQTKVAYVWDVFDAQNRRAKRLAGSSPAGASPAGIASGSISATDREALARLAQASMDEIAGFLSASKREPSFRTAEALGDELPVAQ